MNAAPVIDDIEVFLSRQEHLQRQGWQRRSTHDEPRLSELAQMYRELGLQVLLEPCEPASDQGCASCTALDPERYKTIYTKEMEEEEQP